MTRTRVARDARIETSETEVERNATIVAGKLSGKGVRVLRSDSAEDLANILEAVEAFEQAVGAAGGDLMMDEPPQGSRPQPDDPRFVLPARRPDEHARLYLGRIGEAVRIIQGSRGTSGE
jgi:hypothetical protein